MTKYLFIEAKSKVRINKHKLAESLKSIRAEKIGLISSIQYSNILPLIKKLLESQNKRVFLAKGNSASCSGQILGCDVNAALNTEKNIDLFLFVGTGEFHIMNLALKTEKRIMILNPETASLSAVDKDEILRLKRSKEAAAKKFLLASKMGIIISTKKGQYNMRFALELKKKLERKGKKVFFFICDTLDKSEFENFSCDIWINTACPGISLEDSRIINAEEAINYA